MGLECELLDFIGAFDFQAGAPALCAPELNETLIRRYRFRRHGARKRCAKRRFDSCSDSRGNGCEQVQTRDLVAEGFRLATCESVSLSASLQAFGAGAIPSRDERLHGEHASSHNGWRSQTIAKKLSIRVYVFGGTGGSCCRSGGGLTATDSVVERREAQSAFALGGNTSVAA